jgi:nitrate reductase NapE
LNAAAIVQRRGGSPMETLQPEVRRRWELRMFLFLTVVLFPLLSVALVGGYGFAVWIWQMFAGPPGPISH